MVERYTNDDVLLKKNIELLEQGITLQEYLQKEKILRLTGVQKYIIILGFMLYMIKLKSLTT